MRYGYGQAVINSWEDSLLGKARSKTAFTVRFRTTPLSQRCKGSHFICVFFCLYLMRYTYQHG